MISRRNFAVILTMILVILVLFQFSPVMRERVNEYDQNEHITATPWTAYNVRTPEVKNTLSDFSEREYVVFIGRVNSKLYPTMLEWCKYRNMDMMLCAVPSLYQNKNKTKPKAIVIDGENLNLSRDTEPVRELTKQGIPIIFGTIPDMEDLIEHREFMLLLGIDYVTERNVVVNGVQILDGFLLGGGTTYVKSEENQKMDLATEMPLYHVFSAAKVYITGTYSKFPEQTENQPPLLWRYNNGTSMVFVVNEDYLKDIAGVGYLNAMLLEANEYDCYPVVNAQVFSVINFPPLTDENSELMKEIYNRDQDSIYKDLILPNLISVVQKNGFVPTCFITPQFAYEKEYTPSEKDLIFYLKQIKEQRAEAGISMHLMKNETQVPLKTKIDKDNAFFQNIENPYIFGSTCCRNEDLEEILGELDQRVIKKVSTIVTNKDPNTPTIGYLTEDVTVQSGTADVYKYTYSDDMKMRSLQTALGYTNVVFDMTDIAWPRTEKDEWQKVSQIFSSNMSSYWEPFSGFERLSVSKADARIRNFLALSVQSERVEDKISLKFENFYNEAWVVLRTHGEEIKKISGATYQELEEDAYLIQAQEEEVEIEVKKSKIADFIKP